MKTTNRFNKSLLGAGLALLVTFGMTHTAAAQGDIVFYAPAIETHTSHKGHSVYYTTNNQVFTMAADGSNVRQLTTGTENCYFPSWRPGKTHILFFRGSTLYVMDKDGGGTFEVASAPPRAGADWSPDGKMVCYVGQDASGWSGVLVVDVDPTAKGKNKVGTPVMVWQGSAYGPAWSSDGNKLAFSSYPTGGTPYITVLDLTTGDETTLDTMPHSLLPSWSPDGSQIAFVSGADTTYWQLYIMNSDFSEITQVTDYDNSVLWPTWSDDGTQVAFRIGTGQDWDASIYKLTLDTGELTLLQEQADHPDWNP